MWVVVCENPADGYDTPVLVDRIWPGGLSDEKGAWHEWHKAVVLSMARREW